ncbi:hypothetical protein [Streptacidiphilus sp. ASG 303]|nr:hypothetical protein [Streptacidiphilus sp. ASG 303]
MVGVVILGIVIVALGIASVFLTLWNEGEKLPGRLRRRPPRAG